MDPGFSFFSDSSFLNLLMKLLVIGGGAFTMQKSMALIGNLVSQGGGSNELRDNFSAGGLARMAKGMIGTPFAPLRSIVNDALAMKSRDIGASWLNKVGLGLSGGTSDSKGVKDPGGDGGSGGSSASQNNEKPSYGSDANKTKDAIQNSGFSTSFTSGKKGKDGDNKNNDNANNDKPNQKKNDLVSNVINNDNKAGANKNDKAGEDK
jgi:hypothetical protein